MTRTFANELDLDGSGGTIISAMGAQTRVRGGGFGNRAWLAQLSDLDHKFGFARQFVKQTREGLSGFNRPGVITWEGPLVDGIYEWRGFCVGATLSNWESNGFALIKDGRITEISKDEAKTILSSRDATDPNS